MRINFRHIILALLMLVSSTSAFAQTEEKIIVHLKDGKTAEFLIDDVDYVEIPSTAKEQVPADGVGGTVAEGVDLGLSVKWAEHNLGAESPAEVGGRFAWDADEMQAWGDGWRVPTDDEWEELHEKCTWSWGMRDGVCGRIITAPNGASIFLPATGIELDGEVFVMGGIGVYWTSSMEKQKADEPVAEATGSYFDSANIYRMGFGKANRFSVRLVKQ